MATLRREIPVASGATPVWQKLRDFGAVHTKVAPGFLTDLKMTRASSSDLLNGRGPVSGGALDDENCRLVILRRRPASPTTPPSIRPEATQQRDRTRPLQRARAPRSADVDER